MSYEAAPAAALQAIERVIWANGITGDACARVAATIVEALSEAGFVLRDAAAT